ncbi:MAG: hypothetical protein AMS16_03110 [Planctomycetes bacterium DG_58]|nr:MAG: hypothetical protein AMS16_03110 [Planctomycetes bacterium DG_58]
MSKGGARHRQVLFIICGTVVLILLVGFPILRALHRRHLHALFTGPGEEKTEVRSGFYRRVEYDLTGYLSEQEEKTPTQPPEETKPSILDKGEDELEKSVDGAHLDATNVAAKVKWLKSPTVYKAQWVARFLTIAYPPQKAVFPSNLCSPFIEWRDLHNNFWQVTLSAPDAKLEWKFITGQRRWRIPADLWQHVKDRWGCGEVHVLVKGIRRRGWWGKERKTVHRSQLVSFHISKDPADNAVVYQLVDPPFTHEKTPSIYVRDIRKRTPQLFLSTRQQYCVNCHAWSSSTGRHGKVGLQVRYRGKDEQEHRSYLALYDIDERRGRKIILPFDVKLSTFTSWSPDGTKLAISARQKFPATTGPMVFETQNLGQDSDIAVYDAVGGTGGLLPGACDPKTIEVYPRWSPDGKSIVYSSAPGGRDPALTQYDIVVIPYNDCRGGTAQPIPGASANGKSNHFPRFSPNGKWFSFVRSNWGSLIKASSNIWIMSSDFKTEPRPLECNASYAADSWHSWSSNSRWVVFASKRDDGIFARLYMTRIDDEGKASPAVRVPIEDPRIRMSFNIPEFVENVPRIEERRLFDGISVETEILNVKSCTAEANEPGSL